MKLLILLTIIACIQSSARGYSQTVTLSLENAPLEKAFKEIKKQTGYSFVYTRAQLKNTLPVSYEIKNGQLKDVLEQCFRNQPLSFVIEGRYIVVQTKVTIAQLISQLPPMDIRGRVINENGEPVEGASVVIKGTQKGTTTNSDGYFELKDVNENAVLIITGVSIQTIEIKVDGKSDIKIISKIKITGNEEVIINAGYYKTTDRLKTGNISRVNAETIGKQPVSNPLAALEGRVPGVYIQQTSGVPGSGFNIEIRGLNSLRKFTGQNNGNLPLFIINGVYFPSSSLDVSTSIAGQIAPQVNPLNTINPSDIESIEVLKDADATAIYGSRGSNGVVLITTKKGKEGKTKVDISMYTGAGKVTRTMNLLDTKQYLEMRHEAFNNDGVLPDLNNGDHDLLSWDTTRYTDWQKVLIGGTAHITNIHASVSGGSQNTQFLFGSGYFRETTVFPGDFSDEKLSTHFSLNHYSENKKFYATFSANYSVDNNNLPNRDPTNFAITTAPVAPPVYNSDGTLNWANSTWPNGNPYSIFLRRYKGSTNNFIANTIFSYQVVPDLSIKTNVGFNSIQMRQTSLNPINSQNPAFSPTGFGNYGNANFESWIIEPQAEYRKSFNKHKLSFLLGGTFQQNLKQAQSFFASGFTSDASLENLSAAPRIFAGSLDYSKYRYIAVFGRINYNFEDRYLINLTGRRDGSSRFGPGKQFANFGAIGAGWIFSKESIVEKALSFLSYGKIRGSYGITGNDQIGDYGYLNTYSNTSFPYNGTSGLIINRLFNPDFAWETNKKIEAAVELGFLKDRILLTVSYYRNRSSNQLVGYPLPTITGQSSLPFYNFPATVQNTGWEFDLRLTNIRKKDFSWSTFVNLTIPDNKLVSYPGIAKSSYANTYAVGKSLYIKKGYHFTAVNPQSGNYEFEDATNDGAISYPDDLQALKEIAKRYYGGIQNSFTYKSFQFDIFFQFVKQTGTNYLYIFPVPPGTLSNQPTVVLGRWQKPGDITDVQRFSQDYGSNTVAAYYDVQSSDKFISDASFIRLKNISLSYQLTSKFLSRLKVQNLRIFILGQNLFTITNFLGLDPETQSFQNIPPLRMLTGGFQIIL
ncbi:MAG: SusC/RagA family TonB-linked outer membrane protein [Chitinophagaceae bacterium]